jgi:hypothetical protein
MDAARKPHDCEPAPSSLWLYAFEALEDFDELEPVDGDLARADELANGLKTEETIP